ncbi:hypothetical protein [Photorhabdus namnaonensis]
MIEEHWNIKFQYVEILGKSMPFKIENLGYGEAHISDFEVSGVEYTLIIYPMDFKVHRGGKGVNPREHSKLCDRGERVQPTKRQLER